MKNITINKICYLPYGNLYYFVRGLFALKLSQVTILGMFNLLRMSVSVKDGQNSK